MHETIEQEEIVFLSHKILDLNKKLVESEKAKSRFLSLVAEELNNPMTALLGLVPHLKPLIDETKSDIYALVCKELSLLDFRIQNLVSAAEIESGKIDISFALLHPETIIKEIIEDLQYTINEKNTLISIHNTLENQVISDPRKLYLILKNLIANACTYGLMNGMIDIELAQKSSLLVMTINNQGHGPNVEFKPQIFTRFSDGTHGEHGLGIGLSIVRELCERLGGVIDYDVSSEWVTFSVTLPIKTVEADSIACGSNEFLFDSFDDAIEL
jgi:signal transduction histidine kinase